MPLCGGFSDLHCPSVEVQGICDKVRAEVEGKVGSPFPKYELKAYKQQVVAGMNFNVKILVDEDKYLHLKIYRNLQQEVSLTHFKHNQTLEDELVFWFGGPILKKPFPMSIFL